MISSYTRYQIQILFLFHCKGSKIDLVKLKVQNSQIVATYCCFPSGNIAEVQFTACQNLLRWYLRAGSLLIQVNFLSCFLKCLPANRSVTDGDDCWAFCRGVVKIITSLLYNLLLLKSLFYICRLQKHLPVIHIASLQTEKLNLSLFYVFFTFSSERKNCTYPCFIITCSYRVVNCFLWD